MIVLAITPWAVYLEYRIRTDASRIGFTLTVINVTSKNNMSIRGL